MHNQFKHSVPINPPHYLPPQTLIIVFPQSLVNDNYNLREKKMTKRMDRERLTSVSVDGHDSL